MPWLPQLSSSAQENLVNSIKDWQITHGSLLKRIQTEEDHTVLANPVGTSLFPTPFPKRLFEEALALQTAYQKLYIRVANDKEWLYETLKELIETDDLIRALWGILEEVEKEEYAQDLSLNIFRSDYMLHVEPACSTRTVQLKQVEFNTFSCAGGTHGNKVSDMHRYLQRTGSYEMSTTRGEKTLAITQDLLPQNHTTDAIVSGLAVAHRVYRSSKASPNRKTCILMIVQPHNFNIADERPIEYALWGQDPAIPTYRLEFSSVLSSTSLTSTRELLYHHTDHAEPYEVSVIYMRAGYDAAEYDEFSDGPESRFQLERSRAIKCPSLRSHLTTFKKVQQALSGPNALERYLSEEEAAKVRKTFVAIYPMDESGLGLRGREIAVDRTKIAGYVLKPSLEGGGHNVYGDDIPDFLASVPEDEWRRYILMEKIVPPVIDNLLMSPREIYKGPVVSELGVFGAALERRGQIVERDGNGESGELRVAWSFKTKNERVDEMSVVKGYGCFDSPLLLDEEDFNACC